MASIGSTFLAVFLIFQAFDHGYAAKACWKCIVGTTQISGSGATDANCKAASSNGETVACTDAGKKCFQGYWLKGDGTTIESKRDCVAAADCTGGKYKGTCADPLEAGSENNKDAITASAPSAVACILCKFAGTATTGITFAQCMTGGTALQTLAATDGTTSCKTVDGCFESTSATSTNGRGCGACPTGDTCATACTAAKCNKAEVTAGSGSGSGGDGSDGSAGLKAAVASTILMASLVIVGI